MKIELCDLSEENLQQCFNLKVADGQKQYIASNKDSWQTANENKTVARPFALCCDGKVVGFTMFAFDENYADPNDRYWLWRFMILKTMAQTTFDYRQKIPTYTRYLSITRLVLKKPAR